MTRPSTPAQAWQALMAGNARFVADTAAHPDQDAGRRAELAAGQRPFALLFGCGDSRVAAEIIFDCGLGDLFVVRTAGHVADTAVLGSIEFAVDVLNVPLIVVLGHDRCGAVAATVEALDSGEVPGGYVREIVQRVTPSVLAARKDGPATVEQIEAEHVRQTGRLLMERSTAVQAGVQRGHLAIAGATYDLADGRVSAVGTLGVIDPD